MNTSSYPYNPIAKRYAKALLQVALEKNAVREVYLNMKNINIFYKRNPAIMSILRDPILSPEKKRIFISKLAYKDISPITQRFLLLLEKKQRNSILIEIAKSFLSLYNKSKNLKTVHLTTSVKINQELKERIKIEMQQKLNCAKIKIIEYIDPSIIGGYILRISDNQIDATVAMKLKKLKSFLLAK